MTVEDEEAPLAPLNQLIWKFKRRFSVLTLILLFSIPASITSTTIFLVFTTSWGLTSSTGVVFALLLVSAIACLIATVVIPDSLSDILNEMETSARVIAFSTTLPTGKSPQEKLLNQLVDSDLRIRRMLKINPNLAALSVELIGKTGRKQIFDVYIHKKAGIVRKILGYGDYRVFVKRLDQGNPVTKEDLEKFKIDIKDILKNKRNIPTRVILVSTSGFEDSIFEYLRNKGGIFSKRFPSVYSRIEIVRENSDGTYDVLAF